MVTSIFQISKSDHTAVLWLWHDDTNSDEVCHNDLEMISINYFIDFAVADTGRFTYFEVIK